MESNNEGSAGEGRGYPGRLRLGDEVVGGGRDPVKLQYTTGGNYSIHLLKESGAGPPLHTVWLQW